MTLRSIKLSRYLTCPVIQLLSLKSRQIHPIHLFHQRPSLTTMRVESKLKKISQTFTQASAIVLFIFSSPVSQRFFIISISEADGSLVSSTSGFFNQSALPTLAPQKTKKKSTLFSPLYSRLSQVLLFSFLRLMIIVFSFWVILLLLGSILSFNCLTPNLFYQTSNKAAVQRVISPLVEILIAKYLKVDRFVSHIKMNVALINLANSIKRKVNPTMKCPSAVIYSNAIYLTRSPS